MLMFEAPDNDVESPIAKGPKSVSISSALWKSPKSPKLSKEELSVSSEGDEDRRIEVLVPDISPASEKGSNASWRQWTSQ